jgi:flagellar hook-associated protein 2
VIASLDRGNDKLVLTSKSGGTLPISINDTGQLAAALNLHPDSTTGQVLGQQAQLTIDGRTYTSDSNTVSSAIDGVKINLLTLGSSTLTIAPDTTATTTAAQGIVDAYNTMADALDTMTANGVGQSAGALSGDPTIRGLAMTFRSMLTGFSASGTLSSLADVGITTGAIGSKVGTTTRLTLDTTKLATAIANDPSSVSTLFTNVMTPLDASLKTWTQYAGTIDAAEKTISSQLTALDNQEAAVNARVATRQAALEAQFAQMESVLAQMQTTTSSLTNTIAQQNKSTG